MFQHYPPEHSLCKVFYYFSAGCSLLRLYEMLGITWGNGRNSNFTKSGLIFAQVGIQIGESKYAEGAT